MEERPIGDELGVARRAEKSLLIFKGIEEHFKYGFITHFLFIPLHYHSSSSSQPVT